MNREQRQAAEIVKREEIKREIEKHRLIVELELKNGAYVRHNNSQEIGFIPFKNDGLDRLIWNNNRDIQLSINKDERGHYIQMRGKINARAYLGEEAKPFHELKWEIEREKDLSRDVELERERTLER